MRLALIGVPSSAGAYAPGQEKAPAALRAAGLVDALRSEGAEVADCGDSPVWRWRPDRDEPYAQNLGAVAATVRRTAERTREAAAGGLLPLVVGGDCTVGIGTVAGLAEGGERVGLLYFDMHPDLNVPEAVPDGALDWMGLAHMLNEPGARRELAGAGPFEPLLEPGRVVLFGYAPSQCTPHERAALERLGLNRLDLDTVRADARGSAHDAFALLEEHCDRIAVHFDVDVIDFTDAPLSENTGRNIGLPFDDALIALATLLAGSRLAALTITELNPDHAEAEPGTLPRFVRALAEGFGAALRSR